MGGRARTLWLALADLRNRIDLVVNVHDAIVDRFKKCTEGMRHFKLPVGRSAGQNGGEAAMVSTRAWPLGCKFHVEDDSLGQTHNVSAKKSRIIL